MMRCEEVREMLPALAGDDEVSSSLDVRRHVGRCSGCADELEMLRELRATLATMPAHVVQPPPYLRASLVDIPVHGVSRLDSVRDHLTRNRTAYASGLAVAAVGAVGTALWRSRTKRTALV